MEAISHAGTSLGILANDGVLLAAEKKVTSKLLDPRQAQEKIFSISEYLAIHPNVHSSHLITL